MLNTCIYFIFCLSSEEENDFDKPEPLPEDPALASTDDINKIRDCISKKLRNQDDDEPYTFRELRKEVGRPNMTTNITN